MSVETLVGFQMQYDGFFALPTKLDLLLVMLQRTFHYVNKMHFLYVVFFPFETWLKIIAVSETVMSNYLFEHPLGVWHPRRLLPPPVDCGEVLPARRQLVHGHHRVGRLLTAQLQHREQVEGGRAHVGQPADLENFS